MGKSVICTKAPPVNGPRNSLNMIKNNNYIRLTKPQRVYMLVAKYGFAQSTDYAAQTMDPYFVRQSMGFVRNPWIARI